MNEELRNLLAKYIQQQQQAMPASGNFAPPGPEGPNLPQLSMFGGGKLPGVGAEYNIPMGDGDLTMSGKFAKPGAQDPAEWGARLGYSQKF